MRGPWQMRKIRESVWWLAVALCVLALSGWIGRHAIAAGPAGSDLIGKLEGPEVVTDSAKFPKSFKEAPQLAELVKAGKLPSVQERVSQDPLVIKPVHEIGKYGGTWRRGFSGPADFWNGYRCCGHDKILFWDYTGNKVARQCRQELGDLRRWPHLYPVPAQGHEVVGWPSLHRR